MRWRRILVIVIGLLVVLPITGIGVFIATFNPNAWKPRIQNAVMRATGRELSLNGPISLKWSLVPTIEARDVALANFDGGSRPQMVTAQSIEAEVALLPLLSNRLDIPRLAIIKPDVLIETTQAGRGNWRFTKPATPSDAPTAAAAPGESMDIVVQSMTVEDGTLTWRNGVTGQAVTGTLNSFELLEPSTTSPVTFRLVATYAGTQFDAKGETGSMARLSDTAAKTPWPVRLSINSNDAALSVDAKSTTPMQPATYSGKASGQLADLAQLQPFVPGTPLPSVRELSFSANVADSGPLLTRVSEFTLHAGTSDLSAYAPGLTLTQMAIRAPQPDQPITVQAAGNYADAPLTISSTLGAPSALISGRPFPVDVSLAAAGAIVTAKGTLADPARMAGAELAVSARIPALAPFAALLQQPVPDAKNIALGAHLAEAPGGFAKGMVLTQATLTLPQGDIAGDASVTFSQPPLISGNVTSKRIDLDALLAMKSINPPAPPAAVGPQATAPPATPAPPPERRGNPNLLFSDAPLGLGVLRDADADVQLRIGELHTGGETHRDIVGHFVLKGGKLVLDPISGSLPAGRMSGRLTIDANPPKPPVTLVLRAPGLSVRALAPMLGLPSDASGVLEVDADLNGAGDSLHAIAAELNGTLGLAMVNGQIDNASLNRVLGPILTSASLPLSLINPGQSIRGSSALRCFAARLDMRGGLATFRALYLDSARVKVTGSGTINLADEALSVRLRPQARLANTGITTPLIVGGTIEHPKARIDAANSAQANIMGFAQSAENLAEVPLGAISGAFGGPDRLSSGGDDCANQLAIARGRPGGPQPNSPPSMLAVPANAAKQILNAPKNLLQNLFGK
ncbi:MAG TPA: AsmA family protein [Acetobacteraceae bacterium]|nr:AsmA family protein [Acetobacteraceae bacterium]